MSDQTRFLAVDCGNTQIKLGVYQGSELVANFRLATDPRKTSDEYAVLLRSVLIGDRLAPRHFDGAAISCVVPPLQPLLKRAVEKVLETKCLVVGHETDTGIAIRADMPSEVGADIICLAAGAAASGPLPAVVAAFGTATVFLAVDETPGLAGVAIAPGIISSTRSLFTEAARLPQIDLATPRSVMGQNTVDALRAGVVYGFAGAAERIVGEMGRALGRKPSVIATGGLLNILSQATPIFDRYDPFLSLLGLRVIWERGGSEPGTAADEGARP